MNAHVTIPTSEVHKGNRLDPDEAIVWQGRPGWTGIARDVFHLRGVTAYFAFLFALDAYQAWDKHLPLGKAVHDSVPLAVLVALALAIFTVLAWLVGRTSHYIVTDRRLILRYGIAMPATLSLPFSRIVSVKVGIASDHSGDIAVTLKAGDHMGYLKLWPHARPWHLSRPEPMLRRVPQAAVVAGLLSRAVASAEMDRLAHGAAPAGAGRREGGLAA